MKRIYALLLLGFIVLASCENLVDVDYPANQIGTTQVFNDKQTANAALGGLYAAMRDKSVLSGNYYGVGSLLESYTDGLDCFNNDQNGYMDIFQSNLQATNTVASSVWSNAYQQIYYANSIIKGVEQSTALSDADKNIFKGEALFVRSLIYYYLQHLFGDIPYTTSLDYEYNRNMNKVDATTLIGRVESDLLEATQLLPDEYRNTERIYPNRKVAQLLLARIYMDREDWTLAENMADSILQSPLYQFQTDINEVFHKSGKHILWQMKPNSSGNPTQEATFYYFSNAAPNAYAISDDLVGEFSDDDLRKQNWMALVNYNGDSWYRPYKYKNRSSNTNEYSIVFRLEEVYFIKAECLARHGYYNDALPYLNSTRIRAGLPELSSVSGEEFFQELLSEKRREFFCESGLRFLDLKRTGNLDDLTTIKPDWADYKQIWPLPQSEMLLNPNLLPQNVGY